MLRKPVRAFLVGAAAVALTACGGDGTTGLVTIPAPPAKPTPTPTPAPVPAPTAVPVAVNQSTEFQTVGSDIRIRWDGTQNRYEIMLPGKDWATLAPQNANTYVIQAAGGATLATSMFSGSDKYSYTGFATVYTSDASHLFAYGIPTPAFSVPAVGSATYTGEVGGSGGGYSIGGTAQFDFDFAKGTLGGFLDLVGNDPAGWGPYSFGKHEFVQTVYASGSPTFSGALSSNGAPAGSFSGSLTGPQAQELMGQWHLPLQDVYQPDRTFNASGVFVGKKSP